MTSPIFDHSMGWDLRGLQPSRGELAASEEVLTRSFGQLAPDAWYNVPGAARFRRFQRFSKSADGWEYADDYMFKQSLEYNVLVGDVERTFEPIAKEVMETGLLQRFAERQAALWGLDLEAYEVAVHQFRVEVAGDHAGSSTPEGIHQDGHAYVAIVHWDSHNIRGAESRVYDLNKRLLFAHTLRGRAEALLINDRMCFHDVSELHALDGQIGWRDVFVFDWNLKGDK